jgi:hypothetical protein
VLASCFCLIHYILVYYVNSVSERKSNVKVRFVLTARREFEYVLAVMDNEITMRIN